jgi:hypothetical protein
MKKLVMPLAAWFLLIACFDNGGEHPVTAAACRPAVNVVVPSAGTARQKGRPPVTRTHQREVVQVYWDVSKSMRDFAATGAPQGGASEQTEAEAWTDDLTPVVAALDSSVLLRAHASTVEQYGVGEGIEPLPSARSALRPTANRTALHLAAEQIGTALASGSAQAALLISDLELDTPPRTGSSDATVCRGVPLPSSREAGSLFGRCFESAVLAADPPTLTRANLVVHVFRKSTHGRELFILLFATDRTFGRHISDEVVRRLDFSRHVLFDTGAVAAANVRGCTLTAPSPGVQIRSAGCTAKCFDADAAIHAECDIRRPANDAWIQPAGRGADGAAYESLKKKPGDGDERALVRFAIPCSTPPGRFDATVTFSWHERTPWAQDGNGAFAGKASVRDLFDSIVDAIVRTVPARRLRIGIDLAK